MANHPKPVVVSDLDGNIVYRFSSVMEAARKFNTKHANMLYWIRTNYIKDDMVFAFENPNDEEHHTSYKIYRKATKKDEDIDLNGSKFAIVPYEVRNVRVCVTRCTIREYPQPFIGSAECARCPSFRGRNKKTHQVACSHIMRREYVDSKYRI